jgi:hypothetical protein
VRMGEERGVDRVLVGKPEGKRPLGRPRRSWEDNINLLCTKLIIWEYSSACHRNKTSTEKGQLIGSPVYI